MDVSGTTVVASSVKASSVIDLAWLDGSGAPDACAAVALWWQGKPAVAFTYAYADLARRVAASPAAALVFTETRSTGRSFAPAALLGRPRLTEDTDGAVFSDDLLEQELRRYPPSRVFADSYLLRRENWWYLPRLIVQFDVDAGVPVPVRTPGAADQHLLVTAVDGRLVPRLVAVGHDDGGGSLALTPADGRALPEGQAVLIGQDATFPDMAQWTSWRYRGMSTGSELVVTERPARVGLESTPTIWQRYRLQRDFSKSCRSGIAEAEKRARR
ncbi:hypothetical protein [Arthrobacter sp. H5]|uniref:hypothetical protein n=1 Tax=Arthrobacter sp. H5 TaxID=1267973 RepID=UPI0004842F80|nr:hypothetical protein [Arthrobacter sp. H5]